MARDYSHSSMTRLVKDCTAARDSSKGYIEHPATKEIFRRLPPDLKSWFAKIMFEICDPLALRCGPINASEDDYFELWRGKRDRHHPETHPDYRADDQSSDDDDDEGDGAVVPLGP